MEHELKTDPDVFEQVWNGFKDWEIRFNDRHFRKGHTLWLRETKFSGEEMRDGKPLVYTGRNIKAKVVFILRGPKYGLQKGWVIMSIFPGNGWQD